MFRPNSDTFRGIFGLPGQDQNESLYKTDCFNLLSDCCQEVCSAIQQFSAETGAVVRLWTRSGILKKKSFSKIIITPFLRTQPDFRKDVTSMNFQQLLVFLFGGLGGGFHNQKLHSGFQVLKKNFFYGNIMVTCVQQEKVASSPKVLLGIFLNIQNLF